MPYIQKRQRIVQSIWMSNELLRSHFHAKHISRLHLSCWINCHACYWWVCLPRYQYFRCSLKKHILDWSSRCTMLWCRAKDDKVALTWGVLLYWSAKDAMHVVFGESRVATEREREADPCPAESAQEAVPSKQRGSPCFDASHQHCAQKIWIATTGLPGPVPRPQAVVQRGWLRQILEAL